MGLVSCIFMPLGLIFLISPQSIQYFIPLHSNDPEIFNFAIRIVGIQFIIEPFTGFLASALKIVIRPSATLIALMISLWGFALPLSFYLFKINYLNPVTIWSVLVSARVLFCIQTLAQFKRWQNSQPIRTLAFPFS